VEKIECFPTRYPAVVCPTKSVGNVGRGGRSKRRPAKGYWRAFGSTHGSAGVGCARSINVVCAWLGCLDLQMEEARRAGERAAGSAEAVTHSMLPIVHPLPRIAPRAGRAARRPHRLAGSLYRMELEKGSDLSFDFK